MSVMTHHARSRTSGPAGISRRCVGTSRRTAERGGARIAAESTALPATAVPPKAAEVDLPQLDPMVPDDVTVDRSVDAPEPCDGDLMAAVRAGDVGAYADLYRRHIDSARNLARQLVRSDADAKDLVHEAFIRVLNTLRRGRGPDHAFRAYLLTAIRHVAYDRTRRDRKLEITSDVSTVSGVRAEAVAVPFLDSVVTATEQSLAAQAFARLPERWQAVLWYTEIEGRTPAATAPILGLTPNGVSALAYRAREGLRQAFVQVHLCEATEQRCRTTIDRLGAWSRNGLCKRETAQINDHLAGCRRCRGLVAELADAEPSLVLRVNAHVIPGPGLTLFRRWWVLVMFYLVVCFLSSATLRGRLLGR